MKKILRTAVITILFAFVSFYFTLPALNLRSPMFYSWLLEVAVVYVIASLVGTFSMENLRNRTVDFSFLKKNAKICKILEIVKKKVYNILNERKWSVCKTIFIL